jgi:ribosome-binding factor A
MAVQRTDRLNSLLKEVISDVIKRQVRNPHVNELLTVTRVQITKDLRYATVFVSVIGSEQEKAETLAALQSAAGYIAIQSSQQVVMRYFPELRFKIDDSVEKHMRIERLLGEITKERESRPHHESEEDHTES